MAKTADAVNFAVASAAHFPNPASYVPIIEYESVKKDSPWVVKDFTSRDDCGPSALQRIPEPRRTYGLSVSSDVRSVRRVIKDALAAFASTCGDKASFAVLRDSHAAEKEDLQK